MTIQTRKFRYRRALQLVSYAFVCSLAPELQAGDGILPAPAFDAEALTAVPAANWITNGGNTWNQRHSSLDQINRHNVQELKALWRTRMGSGAEFKTAARRRSCTTKAPSSSAMALMTSLPLTWKAATSCGPGRV